MENDQERKFNEPQIWFFEKINKINRKQTTNFELHESKGEEKRYKLPVL